nr:uncharacterized protein LOC110440049 [Danio rerio]XP_021334690.1 uncharacterized protein LOC110440049 [Danio rerio]|eukprot:XP_021334689.1 uncharacterized protein LOC110440049 [Danio rerio]
MPRTKGSQRSKAAKKRIADRLAADPEEVLPPLKKMAEIPERCVYHNGKKNSDKRNDKGKNDTRNDTKNDTKNDAKMPEKYAQSLFHLNSPLNPLPKVYSDPKPNPKLEQHTEITMNAVSELSPQTSIIRGSFHQGDIYFGQNMGKQCGANSLIAIVMSKMKSVLQWSSSDLDSVLLNGDELYSAMRNAGKINDPGRGYIRVDELPDTHTMNDCTFSIKYDQTLSGLFGVDEYAEGLQGFAMSLDEAVNQAFQMCDACLVNINLNICAVVRQHSWFAVIDSHSRSSDGTCATEGKSLVAFYPNTESLLIHLKKLGESLYANNSPFEVTGVKASIIADGERVENVKLSVCDAVLENETEMQPVTVCSSCATNLTTGENHQLGLHSACRTNEDAGDVEFICQTDGVSFQFSPLTMQQEKHICLKLNLVHNEKEQYHSDEIEMAEPCQTKSIVGDGNCFFRALTYAMTGNEVEHRKCRLSVVNYILQNEQKYNKFLRHGHSSVPEYIAKSKMRFLGTWATELEIQAACDLIGADIFTYTREKWLKFSSSAVLSNRRANLKNGIYLKHVNNCHYEVVICVKTKNGTCAGICASSLERPTNNVSSKPSSDLCKLRKQKLQYNNDIDLKEMKRRDSSVKYKENEKHREKVKEYSVTKYRENKRHKDNVKDYSVAKYRENEEHRENVKDYSVTKYRENEEHKEFVQKYSIQKYKVNEIHKNMVIDYNKQKYKNDISFVQSIKMRNTIRQQEAKNKRKEIDFVIEQFKEKISRGPEYVCSVCHRCCFKTQVKHCNKNKYFQKSEHVGHIAEQCITLNYLHKCNKHCSQNCEHIDSTAAYLWICHTCDRKICEGKIPAESVSNNLGLDPIPVELSCLNSLEQHLIAKHIPFMKMLALPRGGQNGVHGPVTCVPSNVTETVDVLPRSENNDYMVQVKLKRKLTYKGHYEYKFVHTERIKTAILYLNKTNKWYTDVKFNNSWINTLSKVEEEQINDKSDKMEFDLDACQDMCVDEQHNTENEDEEMTDDTLHDRQQHGLFMDTCLQPVDIAQEMLDQHFDDIMSLAPAEGNNPVRVLMDETNEAKCFPVLFPKGIGTFHDIRPEKLTLSRYLNNRILNADRRFAQNMDYIFYGQYLSELNQVVSNVSIALRKGHDTNNTKITPETLTNKDSLQKILHADQGYKFLKPIRGSPVFWQSVQKDLFAMVRQLGIPTWFCSFSSADLRWPELMQTIVKQEGCQTPVDELDWSDRCGMLQRNPVTAARMFDHRFHCFLKDVIMSPAEPIGKIIDYFYRIEFQQRGSPHTHCLFWVENAPQVDRDADNEVVAFVDRYVTCEMPSENENEMYETVRSVQQHSKRHSKTCRKKGTTCRFNFPRPPSGNTFIARNSQAENDRKETKGKKSNSFNEISKDQAKAVMEKVKECLLNNDTLYESTDAFFTSIGINQEIFEAAYNKMTKKTTVVLKRKPADVWVNQYNPDLLRCWNANMDIQFVVDAYSCIVYIISYISKAEREMGLLLANAQKEAHKQGNMDAKQALRKLGSVFLHNREVSAQESVYRLTNMKLKQGSRKVVFIPTGSNTIKMSLPLNNIHKKAQCGESDDIWMTSITERYRARPKTEEFSEMCLATFASEYRVLSKYEKCLERIKLENDMGFVRKRTRTDFAVVRYARFSPTKNPENYYQSILELFLPHFFQSQLKPTNFTSHKEFYDTGFVTIQKDQIESVKILVDTNMSKFEKEAETIQKAEDDLEQYGQLEDAWGQICPEAELERLECLDSKKQQIEIEEDDDVIPDLLPNAGVFETEQNPSVIAKKDAVALMRSLNEKQSQIFYKVRQWCLAKVQGENPDPFHVFISGPGGVGKSILIKSIHYETSRILSKLSENPGETHVLLTAPTGVAAYNINAATIHSTFSIGTTAALPYQPLGDDKINSLRVKFGKLQILIIDEISMVDHKLLAYIHGRLRQIKQTGDFKSFGGVSIIACGDMYQLGPVKGKPLYTEPMNCVNLWETNFSFTELTEIMRQKDKQFAELLSRLRVRKKDEQMTEADVTMLKNCETGDGDESPDIHIYATNSEVDMHNITMLHKVCSDTVIVNAQDFERNAKTGRMEKKEGFHFRVQNTSLEKSLELAVDARIMLLKNINVSDGLVNGVFGTIKDFCYKDENESFPSKIYIEFDDERVGKEARKKNPCLKPGLETCTPIEPEEEKVTSSGGVRRQFPLRLAWACTVHKVQGLTLDKAVVSMKKIFAPGQAYVALSRVTSIDGLIIEDFNEKVIFAKDNIEKALQIMPPFIFPCKTTESFKFTIMLHNVEGLIPHILDIRQDNRYVEADMICVTETWLTSNYSEHAVTVAGYNFYSKPRSTAYDTSQDFFAQLKEENRGGVGIYHREDIKVAVVDLPCINIECLMCNIQHSNTTVAVVYRPPKYTLPLFTDNFLNLVNHINSLSGGKIILGDFNENLLDKSFIHNVMQDFGFTQIVKSVTTEYGTLIDHVYIKDVELHKIKTEIMPTYFSCHECVVIKWSM